MDRSVDTEAELEREYDGELSEEELEEEGREERRETDVTGLFAIGLDQSQSRAVDELGLYSLA